MAKISFFLFIFFLCLQVNAKNAKCEKELKEKCDPNLAVYTCIMDGVKAKEMKFTKECITVFVEQIRKGIYLDPCIAEIENLCPKDYTGKCIKARRNSLSPECSEQLTVEGTPKIEDEEELTKIINDCETGLEINCEYLNITMEMAFRAGKDEKAMEIQKKYAECVQNYMKNPMDEKCGKAMKEYVEQFKK